MAAFGRIPSTPRVEEAIPRHVLWRAIERLREKEGEDARFGPQFSKGRQGAGGVGQAERGGREGV